MARNHKQQRGLTIGNPSARRWSKTVIYAPAGHGKTTLLGTAQEDERTFPMLLLDFEAGTDALVGLDIDVVPIRSWQDANEVYELLANKQVAIIDGEEVDFGEFKSVGIDSISEWHRWALLTRLKEQGPRRKEPDLTEQQDYLIAATQMRRVLREFRDLPVHCFFAAHSKQVDEPRIGRVTVPDMSGQLAFEVAGLVSNVFYLAKAEDDEGEYRIALLHGNNKYLIKARSPWGVELPEEIEEPTITKILDTLNFK